MKKLVSLLLALLMLMGIMAVPTMAADEVSVYLFGHKLEFDVPAQIINGRTMVPMRGIFEALGATVEWDDNTRTATSVRGDRTIKLTIDKNVMSVDGNPVSLDVAPCIVNGRTLVPARAVSESFNLTVDWDGDTRSVLITDGSAPVEETSVFDSMANTIMKYGEYDSAENEYFMLGYDEAVGYFYMPDDDTIGIAFVDEDNDYGSTVVIIVGYYREYYSDAYISYESSSGLEMWMMAEFDGVGYTLGEPYGEYVEEVEADLMDLMVAGIESFIEPSLYQTFGLSLSDIDASLD